MKTAVIDVGGGMRGVYAAGIFDRCLEEGVSFDLGIGVSAGSANLASFLAGQRGRNYVFYTNYSLRKQYMSLRNFILKRNYVDLDYVYGTLSNRNGENPLDYPALAADPTQFLVVATNAQTGETVYFDKSALAQDNYDVLKASSAIPFVCKPYPVGGEHYFDGALGDPVPVAKAFSMGCERVVLILTKPRDTVRTPEKDERIAARIDRKYPRAAEGLRLRAQRYMAGVALAKEYEAAGKLLLLAPEDTFGVDTLTRDIAAVERLYELGKRDGGRVRSFLEGAGR